jgi:hypothetical protein
MSVNLQTINDVIEDCNKIWDQVFATGNIVYAPGGVIYAEYYSGNNFVQYRINATCCGILRERLRTQTPPEYPSNVNVADIYFDIDSQKCRWAEPVPCQTNQPIKVILNPVGNDGAFFTLTESDTCRLEVKFNYLFKIKCEALQEVIMAAGTNRIGSTTTTNNATLLRQSKFNKETELLEVNIQLESLSKEAANTSYSIRCDEFPTTQEVVTATPTTDITQVQKLPFLNTGFGSLTNETQITTAKTKVGPVYETKPVNFCLTNSGLDKWRNIIGDNNYNDFINGNPDSYTCLDVIEIEKQNKEAIVNNFEKLIFECTTPFGEKTNLLNKISELATVQKTLNAEISGLDTSIIGLEDIVDPCSTLIGQFENISASVTLDSINDENVIREFHTESFFPIHANLYQYLTQTQENSGFFVCGTPSTTETWASGCTGLVYPEFTAYGTIEDSEELNVSFCDNIKDVLYQELFNSSGQASLQSFNSSLSSNVFNSNWLTHTFTIDNQAIITGITNTQIKLNVIINSSCDNFCLLIDQINMTKICDDAERPSIFISQSPGFEITRVIDNKKSWLEAETTTDRAFFIGDYDDSNKIRQTEYTVDEERLILNSKEIDLTMNMASAVENDVWCYLVDNPNLLTGTTNPSPCTPSCGDNMIDISGLTTSNISDAITLETFEDMLVSELTDVKDRKTLSAYPTLRAVYDRYINATQYGVPKSNEFTYEKMDEFTGLIKTYWDDLIEQVVPATTLWGSVKLYTNTMFDQQKFKYRSYSSLFGQNNFYGYTIPSPINGVSGQCQSVQVITTFVSSNLDESQTKETNKAARYSNLCIAQMNTGSEFIGKVQITNENDPFFNG